VQAGGRSGGRRRQGAADGNGILTPTSELGETRGSAWRGVTRARPPVYARGSGFMHSADYSTFDRRHFLKHLAGMSLMALPGLGFVRTLRAAAPSLKKDNKSIIILWMSGGPSHIDIGDMKPGESTGGELKPASTSASGIQICDLMKQTAKQMHHLSIIRSLATKEGSHERGRVLMHTARQP